ncbi:AsnC family protein [Corallococcus aberystwythensis]|uniref:AsnC family protein n=2 Tax=Corallococcus aberystwythensis TaxID=2316722 RepID=A0A3A8PPB7_9BACT|nr:AsnC family protein [Corallococcus aberystwythensis]
MVIGRQGQGPEHGSIQHDRLFGCADLDRRLLEELGEDNRTAILHLHRGTGCHEGTCAADGG